MGDDKDPNATIGSEAVPSATPHAPVSVVPRPVSAVPRPLGTALPTSRMPPPPSSRGITPGAALPGTVSAGVAAAAASPGALRSPPPLPQRTASVVPPSSVAASPSVMPRAPATPPPPPQRYSAPPSLSRPATQPPGGGHTALLEQRLGATQIELRKLGSERHTLRARLRREADRLRELESALRAEKELQGQASEEHFATIIGLRTRLAEVEAERDKGTAGLAAQLEQARAELEQARAELEQARAELEQARAELEQARARKVDPSASGSPPARAGKLVQGLRRIRGIGPAYQRVLEQLGVTRVQQVAGWSEADVLAFADKLKIRPDRIAKDDWVGQARSLDPDPDA